jgi:hypothetical protein
MSKIVRLSTQFAIAFRVAGIFAADISKLISAIAELQNIRNRLVLEVVESGEGEDFRAGLGDNSGSGKRST